MGLPAYPPDWATTWKNVQQGLKQAYTGAQSRVRYAAIRAASLVLGAEQGARIVIDPTGGVGAAPAIIFRPQEGNKVATLLATSAQYADEVTVGILGGVNNADTCYGEVTVGGGIIRLAIRDSGSHQIIRNVDVAEDYVSIGSPTDSGRAYVYVNDDTLFAQAADGGTVNIQGNGGRIVIGDDGGIGLYAADNGAFLEMHPSSATVTKNW